ncbi:lipopolysaccharide biosynthesis protein [Pseudidiomarina terrestris]|uniref:lipopolysaccharide biosynthesis protein n=1 Tax=Pseudidiomarina terrestris TaxID=2820060 RepID=UPI002658876A|nr:lipopolysaccharide biosynthesis protein [Pseudidiomarina sp. 1ASP75-5]
MQNMNQKIGIGVIWNFINLFASRGASVLFTLLLARFLAPDAFGLIAMMSVLIELANILVTSGMGQALIRSKSVNEVELSTAFWANLATSGFVYLFLFFAAPFFANFYQQPELIELIRVLGLVVFINSGRTVQVAILSRRMNFKVQALANTVGVLLSGALAISLAYMGAGVWSLVAQILSSALVAVAILWIRSSWRPRLVFSYSAFRELFRFGKNLLLEGVLATLYQNSYFLVIGKLFSAEITGLYYFARRITHIIATQLTGAVQQATYPALATLQDQQDALRSKYRQVIQMMMFICAPLMIAVGGFADPVFKLLFSAEWHAAIEYIEWLVIVAVLYPLHSISLNIMNVKGRSDLVLKVGLIKKSINLALLFAAIPFGVKGIVISQVIGSFIALAPGIYVSGRLIQYSVREQLLDAFKPVLAAALALVVIKVVVEVLVQQPNPLTFIPVAGLCYLVMFLVFTRLLKAEGLNYSMNIVTRRYFRFSRREK